MHFNYMERYSMIRMVGQLNSTTRVINTTCCCFFLVRLHSNNTVILTVKHVNHKKPVLNTSLTPFTHYHSDPKWKLPDGKKSNIPNIVKYGIRVIKIVFAPTAVQFKKCTEYINPSFTLIPDKLAEKVPLCVFKQKKKKTFYPHCTCMHIYTEDMVCVSFYTLVKLWTGDACKDTVPSWEKDFVTNHFCQNTAHRPNVH